MFIKKVEGRRSAWLPDGTLITLADLPPLDTVRWVASRKLMVVRAVMYGLISRDEALKRYNISEEEFHSWVEGMSKHGAAALKVTKRH